ncbi:hypothetical protein ACP70R_041818 [Stipagrostis hirtigluma subsp. patula]
MQDGAAGGGGGDIHVLLSILADGEEQARQLADDPRFQSAECDYRGAARRLQCTLGRAVAVAKAIEVAGAGASGSSRGTDRSDSPRSADESSGGTARDAQPRERQDACKRRKGLPRWTAKFRVPDASLETTPDDGFSWRKYGQKDILGAKFPRGYYRCTYRSAQGCPATKQVQRSDSDLSVFDVTYQGAHTCHQKQRHPTAAAAAAAVVPAHGGDTQHPPPPPQDATVQLLIGFKDSLKVETAEAPAAEGPAAAALHGHDQDHPGAASSFSFPSATFHAGDAPEDAAAAGNSFSSSPAGSSYFAVPHWLQAAGGYGHGYGDYELPGPRVHGAESELGEVVSRATAPAATAGLDYSLYHHGDLDPHLPFPPFGGPYQ